MSRSINMDNLSDDDKVYLAQRGELSFDIMPEDEQRALLDPEQNTLKLYDRANTGTVNTANISTEELEKELAKRRAEAESVDTTKLLKPEGEEAATASDDDDEEVAAPYDRFTRGQLLAEIEERNSDRAEEDQIEVDDTKKATLVAALEADDSEE